MHCIPIYIRMPEAEIVLLKFILESYEGLGILRTLNSDLAEVVILAMEDTVDEVHKILDALSGEISLEIISCPENLDNDWLMKA